MFNLRLCTVLFLVVAGTGCTSHHRLPRSESAAAVVAAADGQARLIDLSQALDETSTFYPSLFPSLATQDIPIASAVTPIDIGIRIFPGGSPFILTDQRNGYCISFTTGEHTGTHMDSPSHFVPLGRDIDRTPIEDLIRPAAVIDVREQTKSEPLLSIDHKMLLAWEESHGEIPQGAMVFLLTGAAKRAGDSETDHPGFSEDAAEFMRLERQISGVGTDSLSPDISGNMAFPVHKRLLADECMILENLMNLDQLPPLGAEVLMGPMPVREGSGSPTRVIAIMNGSSKGVYGTLDLTHRLDKRMPYVLGHDPLYSDLDIPILDDLNPFEFKLNFLPKGLPIDRDTTARPFIHGYHNGYFSMGTMTGTHVTFPSSSGSGPDAADYPIGRLIRPALVVDLTDQADGATVGLEAILSRLGTQELEGKFVILNTKRGGTGFKRGNAQPGISEEAAADLMRRGVVGILTDGAAIDAPGLTDRPAERAVHAAGGLAGGFIRKPGRLNSSSAVLAILPMPIRGSGAAPARILAYEPLRESRFRLRTPE